ncbi:MAG: hypothetical protein OXE82_05070, partial [Rhodobacter sp.]|nr:hypothetical protein [Rhodobacter sp.]
MSPGREGRHSTRQTRKLPTREAANMPWWKDIPIARTTPIETARLQFDPANPRYSSDRGLPYDNDAQIVTFLYESSDLGELLQSISTSGYVDIEPLIVMGRQERLIVLEG